MKRHQQTLKKSVQNVSYKELIYRLNTEQLKFYVITLLCVVFKMGKIFEQELYYRKHTELGTETHICTWKMEVRCKGNPKFNGNPTQEDPSL